MKTLTPEQFQLVVEKCDGSALDAVWEMFSPVHQSWTNFPAHIICDFDSRRWMFLWVLEKLLLEGHIKLHKSCVFLETSIAEQVEAFREAFPVSEKDADEKCTKLGAKPAYEGVGMSVWWFLDICPAGAAWRQADGSYAIAD